MGQATTVSQLQAERVAVQSKLRAATATYGELMQAAVAEPDGNRRYELQLAASDARTACARYADELKQLARRLTKPMTQHRWLRG